MLSHEEKKTPRMMNINTAQPHLGQSHLLNTLLHFTLPGVSYEPGEKAAPRVGREPEG